MGDGLRVLIVTPTYVPEITGNAITAQRLYKGLSEKGVEVQVVQSSEVQKLRSSGSYSELCTLNSELFLIHALHALKGGMYAMEMAESLNVPFVVTVTGTDLNIDLLQSKNPQILDVFDKAARIITYSPLSKEGLLSRLPSLSRKASIIRPSVNIGEPKGKRSLPPGFNFLLPSGIRKVKDPVFAIRPIDALKKEFPSTNLTVVGPALDDIVWKNFSDAINGKEWISYIKVSHDEMPDIYSSADIVLNTSVSEGLSNAILEAMHFGKAVLASDCDGNRGVISDGHDGILYHQGDEEDFIRRARILITDTELREILGRAAKEKVENEYSLDAEIEGHLRLYQEVVGGN